LVDKNKDDNLDSEIAKRLDDLFGEGDAFADDHHPVKAHVATADEQKPQDPDKPAADNVILDLDELAADETPAEHLADDHPLAELKNLVLSIDWEITDEVLVGFLAQIDDLKNTYKKEKIVLMFLQLLGSLGEYIKTNRGNAHPRTFKILNSVFSSLEDVVVSKDIAESEKKKILRAEMDKYKQLRKQVSKKKAIQVSKKKIKPVQQVKPKVKAPETTKAAAHPDKVFAAAKTKNLTPKQVAAQPYDTLAEAVEELKQFIHSELSALRQELEILQKSK
jgi:hypothetical protein